MTSFLATTSPEALSAPNAALSSLSLVVYLYSLPSPTLSQIQASLLWRPRINLRHQLLQGGPRAKKPRISLRHHSNHKPQVSSISVTTYGKASHTPQASSVSITTQTSHTPQASYQCPSPLVVNQPQATSFIMTPTLAKRTRLS